MIIAVCGRKHSGKTTTINILNRLILENSNKTAQIINFVDPIKRIGSFIANEDINFWNDDNTKKEFVPILGCTRREFMIKFGTDFAHPLNESMWIDYFDNHIKNHRNVNIWLIGDLRMIHEVEYLNKLNQKVLILKTVGDPANLEDGSHVNHKSENQIDSIDAKYIIDTDRLSKRQMIEFIKLILITENII